MYGLNLILATGRSSQLCVKGVYSLGYLIDDWYDIGARNETLQLIEIEVTNADAPEEESQSGQRTAQKATAATYLVKPSSWNFSN